jgi:hypothetical protein
MTAAFASMSRATATTSSSSGSDPVLVTGPHVWIHRLALSAVRGQRMDPWVEDTPWDRQHDAGVAPTSSSPTTTD